MIVAYATPVTLALGGPDDPFLFGVFNEIATAQVKVYVYNYNDPIRLISCDDGWVFSGGHWWVPNRSFPRCGAYEKFTVSITLTDNFDTRPATLEVNRGDKVYCTYIGKSEYGFMTPVCEVR